MFLFIAIVLFLLLIIIHEYGHFLVAKRNGVEVEEFGIGFPPKIAGKKMGKGIFRGYYTLNWLPLGGFVRLKGENDADKRKGSYGRASFWAKTKIIMAGVVMNFVAAAVIFTILAAVGMPRAVDGQFSVESDRTVVTDTVRVGQVEEDSVAYELGLEVGDTLVALGGTQLEDASDLGDLTEELAGTTIIVDYEKDGQQFSESITLRNDEILAELNANRAPEDELFGYFGITPANIIVDRYGWSAPIVGIGTTVQLTGLTYEGLGGIVTDLFNGDVEEASESVAGPVGIFVILSNIGAFGFVFLLFFVGVISLTLAVMNSLPIPALDGGRFALSGLFKLMRKPLTEEVESRINAVGFSFLMLLIILITIVDIDRVFG